MRLRASISWVTWLRRLDHGYPLRELVPDPLGQVRRLGKSPDRKEVLALGALLQLRVNELQDAVDGRVEEGPHSFDADDDLVSA